MTERAGVGPVAGASAAPSSEGLRSPAQEVADASPLPENKVELVFGLVGPTGVDLTKLCDALAEELKSVSYDSRPVHLSDHILTFAGKTSASKNEYERIAELMTAGTDLRRDTKQADVVARLGIAEIRTIREQVSGDANVAPKSGLAYIVRSFKRPEEVALYRDTYGKAFNLISVYSPRLMRIQHLTRKFTGIPPKEDGDSPETLAVRLIGRDYDEEGKLGQQMGKTFPLADFFVTSAPRNQLAAQMKRLVRLIFGDPYISPTRDEEGMFFAQAAALRSLDLSRQVGAAIVTDDGDILATGCNEVPKFGGGLYWDGDPGIARDFELGRDSNAVIKTELVEDAVRRLRVNGWLSPAVSQHTDQQLARQALFGKDQFFRDSRIFDVIEFGRAVHAEMAAIAQSAKLGVPVRQARMFCTTFPCHICARHIVAAGLKEVVFIEPYEKSRTNELFADSISVEPGEASSSRANFRSFVGVAPRRYMDFFYLRSERKTDDGEVLNSDAIASRPRVARLVPAYIYVEQMMVKAIAVPPRQSTIDERSTP